MIGFRGTAGALGLALCAISCGWACAALAAPAGDGKSAADLTSLSIDQLMDLQVTSVSKKAERLGDSAAAIAVITQDDIRRSGMTSVPELLRMVPGLDVAQLNSSTWAISARGFNSNTSTKLLVLIDGRSVYNPASAVYWDVQDLILEDIERIEVIRGPAGALYGANAVNGVINIITKSSKDTQGALLTAGGGNLQSGTVSARYGGKLGEDGFFRIYAKGFRNARFINSTGANARDSWNQIQTGFRIDWAPSAANSLTAVGAYYDETGGLNRTIAGLTPPSTMAVNVDQDASGEYGLVRWQHDFSTASNTIVQAYYDRTDRDWKTISRLVTTTYDIDFQHRLGWGANHDIVWGAGFRNVDSVTTNTRSINFIPSSGNDQIFSLFAQDEIALREDLHLTVGSKLEHNNFTGFEYQPSLALSWRLSRSQTLWTSLSRVIRTPSFIERALYADVAALPNPVVGAPPLLIQLVSNPAQKSEHAVSWELGYRGELSPALSIDVAGFYTHYTHLTSVETEAPVLVLTPPVHLVVPTQFANLIHGDTFGVELSAKWQVTPLWRIAASYTWFGIGLHLDPASNGEAGRSSDEGSAPDHQTQIHSYLDLPSNLEFDSALYYVDALRNGGAPADTRVDVRLGWRPSPRFELSVSGENLTQARHTEFSTNSQITSSSEVPRSVFVKATVRL